MLLDGEKVVKTYTVAIGRGGLAPKERQGDHKTPEGIYQIDRRKVDSRFHRALHISYPNDSDCQRASKFGVSRVATS
jgi:murein L,D-transpeptidase YafK